MDKNTIAIIGGGACGVAAFIELVIKLKVNNLEEAAKIIIIEPCSEIGAGLAFGTKQSGHLLNTQADLMGIHTVEPAHYSKWLQKRKEQVKDETHGIDEPDDAYSTRRLYSDYLKEQFNFYKEKALNFDLSVEIINDEALDLKQVDDSWQIILATYKPLMAAHVILAAGTPKPNNYPHLEGSKNYFDFPWPSKPILNNIPKDATVGVLGTSLSAIDTVMTLTDNQHNGKIILYAPTGLLPRVQPKNDTTYQRKFLTAAAVHNLMRERFATPTSIELFRLYKQEVEHYNGEKTNWKNLNRKGKSASALLNHDIEIAEKGGDAFINILYSLRDETAVIWYWLSADEKNRFKKWIGEYFTTTRYAMPLANAKKLQFLFEKNCLEVKAGLEAVDYDESAHQFKILFKNGEHEKVSYLINATGPATKVKKMKSQLIQNLYKSAVIIPYSAGGIKINPLNMQVVNSYHNKNLYAAGHLCNGMLIDVNAVWYNVKTIYRICESIINHIKN